jgi:hypothetical protein
MKLTETEGVKSLKSIKLLDGVYMRSLPMSQMQDIIEKLSEADNDNQVDVIDTFFEKIVVDENGEAFEDLVENKASDILPLNTIMEIITAFQGAIVPGGK